MEKYEQRSIIEIMNEVLSTIRDYYDSEYVYYIEKDADEILTIYEWCAQNIPWQREKVKMLEPEQYPRWLQQEITDTTEADYSIFRPLNEEVTAVLAVVGVHKGGCELSLMRAVLPYISEAIILQKTQMQQQYLSYHDNLTGLLNRNSFVAYIEEVKQEELKSAGALSVDINGLKNFNKEFGRNYGDEIVTRVGEVLEEYFKGAMVFRLTGDEYLVIMENITYEQFVHNVNDTHNKLDNISLGLVSMGYAWQKVEISMNDLVSHAEDMMREEKRKYYKNRKKGHHEPVIKQDLLDDIEAGRFIVCLIPKMDVVTEEVVGAEAVVRYHHPDLGVMNPQRYMTLLEETKLSHFLDLYVFEQVCKTLQKWEQQGKEMVSISVNLSSSTLQQEDFTKKMLEIVNQYHVPCEYLEVEVSESYTNMNQEMLSETGNKIRKENIRVILDHFGAKESSFSILTIMKFDGLKLDKSLITNIVGNNHNQIVAKAVIDVCHQMGACVIASGIETQDQLNVLKELGCDYAQGSLFNKAITLDTFEVRYLTH